jgi:hypothetical protein
MKLHSIFLLALSFCCHHTSADTLTLRGARSPMECRVLSGGIEGLHVVLEQESAVQSLIPWSTISSIETEAPMPALQIFLTQGEKLWRAKIRFIRGDLQLAEPSFALLFREFEGSNSEDARLASEGLLRCYLARGELDSALHPWLETVKLEEFGVESPFAELLPILDSSTLLSPYLPPVWEVDENARVILEKYKQSSMKTTSSLAKVLLSQGTDEKVSLVTGVEDGKFLPHIIAAANGDPESILALEKTLDSAPSWKQNWGNYFIALGLVRKEDASSKKAGMLLFAKIAANSQRENPWLSGSAMFLLADELDTGGFNEEAKRIRKEMRRVFPAHPLLHTAISK